jgi:hypothetical protein
VFQIGFTTPTIFSEFFQIVYLFFLGRIQNSGLFYFEKALTCGAHLSAANLPHAVCWLVERGALSVVCTLTTPPGHVRRPRVKAARGPRLGRAYVPCWPLPHPRLPIGMPCTTTACPRRARWAVPLCAIIVSALTPPLTPPPSPPRRSSSCHAVRESPSTFFTHRRWATPPAPLSPVSECTIALPCPAPPHSVRACR